MTDDGCTVWLPSGPIYSNMSASMCVFFLNIFWKLIEIKLKKKKKTWNSCWVDRGRRVNFIWYYAKTSKKENKFQIKRHRG